MARIRTVKPSFFAHEELSALAADTHLLAAALLVYADDEGYFLANPKLVKAGCIPLREVTTPISDSLRDLAKIGFVKLGRGADSKEYGLVVNLTLHQVINRPSPSSIKTKDITWNDSLSTHGILSEYSVSELEMEVEGNLEVEGNAASAACAELARGGQPSTPANGQHASEFVFPTSGKGPPQWALPQSKFTEYLEAYPGIDVTAELRKARQWCRDNVRNRKTAGGMLPFLTKWLNRAQNSNRPVSGGPKHVPRPSEIIK